MHMPKLKPKRLCLGFRVLGSGVSGLDDYVLVLDSLRRKAEGPWRNSHKKGPRLGLCLVRSAIWVLRGDSRKEYASLKD